MKAAIVCGIQPDEKQTYILQMGVNNYFHLVCWTRRFEMNMGWIHHKEKSIGSKLLNSYKLFTLAE
jgi:hypothetical protein